jgi:hypothetical protein
LEEVFAEEYTKTTGSAPGADLDRALYHGERLVRPPSGKTPRRTSRTTSMFVRTPPGTEGAGPED